MSNISRLKDDIVHINIDLCACLSVVLINYNSNL